MKFMSKKFLSSVVGLLMVPGVLFSSNSFSVAAGNITSKTVSSEKASESLSDSKKLLNAFDEIYVNGWQTDRLVIEQIKESDVETLSQQFFDEDITRYYFNIDNDVIYENFKYENINQVRDFIKYRQKNSALNYYLSKYRRVNYDNLCGDKDFVIRIKSTNEAIGILGYDVVREGAGIEMGINYFIGKKYQGKGYAKEAAVGLTEKIFNSMNQGNLMTTIHKNHAASQKIITLIIDNIVQHDKTHKYRRNAANINNLVKYTLRKTA